MKTRHGGNVGTTPFYLQPGQCEPEYDQGHFVIVWYDDLVLKQEDLDKATKRAEAAESRLRALEAHQQECSHGHKTRKVGCVSCVLVFDREATTPRARTQTETNETKDDHAR